MNSDDVADNIKLPTNYDDDDDDEGDADDSEKVVRENHYYRRYHNDFPYQPPSKFHCIFMVCGLIFVIQLLLSGIIFHQITATTSSLSSTSTTLINNSTTTTSFLEFTSLRRRNTIRQTQQKQQSTDELLLLQLKLDHLESELSNITKSNSYDKSVNDHDDDDDEGFDDDEFGGIVVDDSEQRFVPFMIRDARRLVPNFVKPTLTPKFYKEFHIFDYVDLDSTKYNAQGYTKNSALYHNGQHIGKSPCQKYTIQCYKEKILQVLEHLLFNMTITKNTYYFYMESDNELCVPLSQIRDLAFQEQRYFISTGIGFSGWIMRYDFLFEFYKAYNHRHRHGNEGPDPIGATLLMEKKAWSVTRQYLVSHTLTTTQIGSDALTVGRKGTPNSHKHLPRCFEPRRGVWPISETDHHDLHGWDYFNYDLCPTEPIFPCKPGQLEEITKDDPDVHVEDTLFNGTANMFLNMQKGRKRKQQKGGGGILGGRRKYRLFDGGGIGQQQQKYSNMVDSYEDADTKKENAKVQREKAQERFRNYRRDRARKNS